MFKDSCLSLLLLRLPLSSSSSSSPSVAWAWAQALPSLLGLSNVYFRLWPSFLSSDPPTIQPPCSVPAKSTREFCGLRQTW